MDAKIKLTKARSELIFNFPFFGAIALRLGLEATDKVPTFGVDGYTIFYNPEFLETLTVPNIMAILAHEVLHVIMLHATRLAGRNKELWNIACDYAINPLIQNNMTLPADALLDVHNFKDMHAEDIYKKLLAANIPKPEKPLSCGELITPPQGKGLAEIEADARELAVIGGIAAKEAGKFPANIERLIGTIVKPQIPWRDTLRDLLTGTARGDYSWSTPNKRLLDIAYLPFYVPEPSGELVLAIDTSGSVNQNELDIFASEITAIMQDNSIEKITVLYVDTKVCHVETYDQNQALNLKPQGGGGTLFNPAFDWVEQNTAFTPPSCFIYFTDGQAAYPETPPDYPVIWCITDKHRTAPWGITLNLRSK